MPVIKINSYRNILCLVLQRINILIEARISEPRNVYERLLTKYPDIIIVSKNPTTLQLPIDKVQSDQSDF